MEVCFQNKTTKPNQNIVVEESLINFLVYFFRAPIEEMQNNAVASGAQTAGPGGMKSSLVDNAAPIAFTGSIDSNV